MLTLSSTTASSLSDSVCRHFRICGGCKFQDISYDQQLATKEALVREAFGIEPHPILPSAPWHYRNKMEFSFGQAKSGEQFLGLMKKRGRVENLEECFLTSSWFLKTLNEVRLWWQKSSLKAYHPPSNTGELRTLILREGVRTGEKMAMLTTADVIFDEKSLVAAFSDVDTIILRRQIIQKKVATRFEITVLKGSGYIHEKLFDDQLNAFQFRIRGPSFFQPNTLQAEKIYRKAVELADLKGDEQVLDLYCGTGTLGIFAAERCGQVLGIEIIEEAVMDANINIQLNGITNMEVMLGDVAELLPHIQKMPSVVFVDPPRAGLGNKTVEHLLQIGAEKIIYVSCNPLTQAEDCKALQGYKIISLHPIDQFPQTPHVENIALLHKI